jgi:hypothetical protein
MTGMSFPSRYTSVPLTATASLVDTLAHIFAPFASIVAEVERQFSTSNQPQKDRSSTHTLSAPVNRAADERVHHDARLRQQEKHRYVVTQ